MTAEPGKILIEPLRTDKHDRSTFNCGVESLNHYLKHTAKQDMHRGAAAPFVLFREGERRVLGYYTLSMNGVSRLGMPEELLRDLPKYADIPAVLLGRLAVDVEMRGQGVGQLLLASAAQRSLCSEIAWCVMVVDALDERAAQFYCHHEFVSLKDKPLKLFLPRKAVEAWFQKASPK